MYTRCIVDIWLGERVDINLSWKSTTISQNLQIHRAVALVVHRLSIFAAENGTWDFHVSSKPVRQRVKGVKLTAQSCEHSHPMVLRFPYNWIYIHTYVVYRARRTVSSNERLSIYFIIFLGGWKQKFHSVSCAHRCQSVFPEAFLK